MNDGRISMRKPPRFLVETAICILLCCATLAVFWQVRTFEFINFDDQLYVADNRYVQQGLSWETVVWAFTDATRFTNYWVPLTWLSILLDYQLYGMHAGGYHLTNLILHILNTVLLFLALRWMTGHIWRSALVAALFALHPLHVESVAWVTERKDVLSTLFWMLCLLAYTGYVRRPGAIRYLAVFVFFVMGLMAKPMLVTLPFVFLLLDYWPFDRLKPTGTTVETTRREMKGRLLRLTAEKAPFLGLIAVVSVMAFLTQQEGGAVKSLADYPMNVRIGNALVTYVLYIGKMFWPVRLAFFYPHPGALPLWQVMGAGVLLAAMTLLSIAKAGRYPYVLVGWLWYIGTLVPVIGIVVIGNYVMADRYTYISLIGLFVPVVWAGADLLPHRWRQHPVVWVMSVFIITVLALTAWRQTAHWRDSIALCRHAVAVTRNNLGAYNNLAGALAVKGRYAEALKYYEEALKIDPSCLAAYNNLGLIYEKLHQPAEAVAVYEKALSIDPGYALAHNNLANVLSSLGKTVEAMHHYLQAISSDPDYAVAHYNLANVYLNLGRLDESARQYREALRIDPFYAEAHNNLGSVLLLQGATTEAIAHFSKAVQILPAYAEAQRNLRTAQAEQRRKDDDLRRLRDRTTQNPDDPLLHEQLAEALKSRKQYTEAFLHYQKSVELDPDRVEALNQMGILSAMKGDYSRARSYFQQSIDRRPDAARAYYLIAGTYARQKKADESIRWLERAVQKGYMNFKFLESDPNFEHIRNTAYFKKLMQSPPAGADR